MNHLKANPFHALEVDPDVPHGVCVSAEAKMRQVHLSPTSKLKLFSVADSPVRYNRQWTPAKSRPRTTKTAVPTRHSGWRWRRLTYLRRREWPPRTNG